MTELFWSLIGAWISIGILIAAYAEFTTYRYTASPNVPDFAALPVAHGRVRGFLRLVFLWPVMLMMIPIAIAMFALNMDQHDAVN
jgi:uncharacterized membrane protein YdjX (TVP38/TMEM64 family)